MSVNKVMVGEALVNDNDPSGTMAEIAHIDLLIGPRGSAVETAFCSGLVNNKDGFTSLLAVIAPNLPCKPNTMMFNKVTIKGNPGRANVWSGTNGRRQSGSGLRRRGHD